MTSSSMDDLNWGERRVAERAARQRRRARWIVGSAVAIAVGAPFVAGLIDGLTHSRMAQGQQSLIQAAAALVFVTLAGWFAWRNWAERDEVERRTAVNSWAAIGMATLAFHPLFRAAQPLLRLADPAETAWIAALGAGAAVMLYQKARS